ncbi:MAG: DMT family transporter [Thermoplasmata archaeon]|jgi:drug/metabolite transporter (DMT)-like permease
MMPTVGNSPAPEVVTGRSRGIAVFFSLLAALGWASYYIFVLRISPGTSPSAILVYPFLVGGAAYAGWTVLEGHGKVFARLWSDPSAYLRTGLLVTMQFSVLAATYLTGPVDASLLSLIGDVVATPLVVAFILGQHRAQIRSRLFAVGLVLSLAGGTMAIVGGRSLTEVHSWGWLAVPAVPLSVAFYFLLTARANERAPPSAVVGQSMLAAGAISLLLAPLVPGGWGGIAAVTPGPFLVLVVTGLTSFFLAPALYFVALRRVGLVIPPMLMTGIPVFTLLLSAVVLGLGLPVIAILGIPVAVVGALLTLRAERAEGPTGPAGPPPPEHTPHGP